MAQSKMSTAQALTLAVLTLEFEAEEAHTTGNGVWRYEATEAAKRLQEVLSNSTGPNGQEGEGKMLLSDFGIGLDINTIEQQTERLKALPGELFTAQRAIENDKIFSEEVKAERRKQLAQWGENEKYLALRKMWGNFDSKTGTWSGGVAERAQEAITGRIAELRAAAVDNDPLDANRVLLAIREVEAIAADAGSIEELIEYYQTGSVYERRALQTIGGKMLAERWPREPRTASTAKRWRDDLQAEREPKELPAVLEAEARLKFALNRAAGITNRDDSIFSGKGDFPFRAQQFHKAKKFGPGPKATPF